jgi:hypothetical protein
MNKSPIETAKDADLRQSPKAMQRAAQRARALAAQTGTAIVVSRNGAIEQIHPHTPQAATHVQQPPAPDGDQP